MNLQKAYTVDEAQKKLEFFCTYQERCHKEVRQKLKDMNMIPLAVDKIIVHLIEHNFLNEERYANAFTMGKFRIKKWGKQRITLELKRREISKFLIDKAISGINNEDYLETFNTLAEKKFESITETNKQTRKRKLADYLLYRGWESHLVYDKVNELVS